MREASDSDFVLFDDAGKAKNFSCFDSIFFEAPVNITTTEEKQRIRMFFLDHTRLLFLDVRDALPLEDALPIAL